MLFNSIDFAIFLPIVFILYWSLKNLKFQNSLLLVASFIFYGWWDWRFLGLLVLSSIIDFFSSILIYNTQVQKQKRALLLLSIIMNLGILVFFKYFNFFVDNFVEAFRFFGYKIQPTSLNIILPVGVSFYTFQALSYTIDVYRNKLVPTKDPVAYFAFISFFPQLVAGPIERATNFLPQFYSKRTFNYELAADGMRQMLWGLLKKIVVADNCARVANEIFQDHSNLSGNQLIIGAIFFSFQIYADFSGYSDIAIGTARLFGFRLMRNFHFPYFSRDIAEFWRRWHISLTTWFRDYVYIPLGGSQGSNAKKIINIFIIFLLSGFWHGANWTFITWGAINAFLFIPLMVFNHNRKNMNTVAEGKLLPSIKESIQMVVTFSLVTFGWIFFRSINMHEAIEYIRKIVTTSFLTHPGKVIPFMIHLMSNKVTYYIIFIVLVEWLQRDRQHGLEAISENKLVRWSIYLFITAVIIYFGAYASGPQEFIYFQF